QPGGEAVAGVGCRVEVVGPDRVVTVEGRVELLGGVVDQSRLAVQVVHVHAQLGRDGLAGVVGAGRLPGPLWKTVGVHVGARVGEGLEAVEGAADVEERVGALDGQAGGAGDGEGADAPPVHRPAHAVAGRAAALHAAARQAAPVPRAVDSDGDAARQDLDGAV